MVSINVEPISDAVGAKITNIDLGKEMTPDVLREVHQAWLDYLVLVYPEQQLDEEDQIRFTEKHRTQTQELSSVCMSKIKNIDAIKIPTISVRNMHPDNSGITEYIEDMYDWDCDVKRAHTSSPRCTSKGNQCAYKNNH